MLSRLFYSARNTFRSCEPARGRCGELNRDMSSRLHRQRPRRSETSLLVRCLALQLYVASALLVALPAPSFAGDAVAEPPAKATATEFPPELVKFTPYDQNPV